MTAVTVAWGMSIVDDVFNVAFHSEARYPNAMIHKRQSKSDTPKKTIAKERSSRTRHFWIKTSMLDAIIEIHYICNSKLKNIKKSIRFKRAYF